MSNSDNSKSIYRRGADDGLIFGLYLSLMFVVMAVALTGGSVLASLTGMAMILAVPVLLYFFLRKSYLADDRRSPFSAMWLQGICIFFFGSLLMSMTAYVYMRVIHAGFIPEVFETAREAYENTGTEDGATLARMIKKIQDNNLYPTPATVAMEIVWIAVFTGSMLSMLVSLIVRTVCRRQTPPPMR